VHVALRSGLELPAFPLPTGRDAQSEAPRLATLRRVVAQAASAGFATVWFADRGTPDDRRGSWGDPCILAAAFAEASGPLHLGVVTGEGGGRHPSAVARDVTALDHVSGGRAALRLDYPGRVADAAQVCRRLFTEDSSTVHGPGFHTEGAVNRPPPVQPGGPPLVATAVPGEVDGELVAWVDAVCVAGGPDQVARARAAAGDVAVLWAGVLAPDAREAAREVERLRSAGAAGVICRAGDTARLTEDSVAAWAAASGAGS
jgi:alkanesulfonate monooxygenase SsuD/methylene tetrahydromethanopterin reductase-like flavin-dependent oxidoreductase (luciferase family)